LNKVLFIIKAVISNTILVPTIVECTKSSKNYMCVLHGSFRGMTSSISKQNIKEISLTTLVSKITTHKQNRKQWGSNGP